MFIGDGAKLVRDAFALAKEKAPTIIFIDEIDAVGTKRFDSDRNGDREVQRTMLELLNQLDGFSSSDDVKVNLIYKYIIENDLKSTNKNNLVIKITICYIFVSSLLNSF